MDGSGDQGFDLWVTEKRWKEEEEREEQEILYMVWNSVLPYIFQFSLCSVTPLWRVEGGGGGDGDTFSHGVKQNLWMVFPLFGPLRSDVLIWAVQSNVWNHSTLCEYNIKKRHGPFFSSMTHPYTTHLIMKKKLKSVHRLARPLQKLGFVLIHFGKLFSKNSFEIDF